ncbi:MAG: CinA family protein, partial [Parabacteroides sp.]|nr:CinA family protein [Parabacteroides sp.]
WIAAAYKEQVVSSCFHFGERRDENIQQAANMALKMLIDLLESVKN